MSADPENEVRKQWRALIQTYTNVADGDRGGQNHMDRHRLALLLARQGHGSWMSLATLVHRWWKCCRWSSNTTAFAAVRTTARAMCAVLHCRDAGQGSSSPSPGMVHACAERLLMWHVQVGPAMHLSPEVLGVLNLLHPKPVLSNAAWTHLARAVQWCRGKHNAPWAPNCTRMLLGVLVSGGSAVARRIEARGVAVLRVLMEEGGLLETLAAAVYKAVALALNMSAVQHARSQARCLFELLPEDVKTHEGALADRQSLRVMPACIVCLAMASDDPPGTPWRWFPCGCCMHALCFKAWVTKNDAYWEKTECLRCRADLRAMAVATALALR